MVVSERWLFRLSIRRYESSIRTAGEHELPCGTKQGILERATFRKNPMYTGEWVEENECNLTPRETPLQDPNIASSPAFLAQFVRWWLVYLRPQGFIWVERRSNSLSLTGGFVFYALERSRRGDSAEDFCWCSQRTGMLAM
ncbi:hypothetical protein AC578_3868 [Pseudocercospora eumusae]|uniref:Uncharacterized protein n=1 Tax=Pseudocercospora eumusae TaxID=321146 RepID=A0A139H1L0_9PEZI|nr:hypothetical protein AC578_3868 [Pseudocercospora eumusae]